MVSLYKRSSYTYLDAFNNFFFFLALEISNVLFLNLFLNVQNETERIRGLEHLPSKDRLNTSKVVIYFL